MVFTVKVSFFTGVVVLFGLYGSGGCLDTPSPAWGPVLSAGYGCFRPGSGLARPGRSSSATGSRRVAVYVCYSWTVSGFGVRSAGFWGA